MSVWEVKDKDGKVEYLVSDVEAPIGATTNIALEFAYREIRKRIPVSSKCVANLPRSIVSKLTVNGSIYTTKEELKEKLTEIKESAEEKAKGLAEAIANL